MRNKSCLFFILFLCLPILLIGLFLWWKWAISPVDIRVTAPSIFIIKKGESTQSVIKRLYETKLIKSPLVFKFILYKDNLTGKIQAGDFRLSSTMNAREIALQLIAGRLDVWVTIQEGLRQEEIFEILKEEGFNINFSDWLKATESKEGYLFPDTYLVPQEATAEAMVNIMLNNFTEKTKDLGKALAREDIIVASLIEREVRTEKDRTIVGGILRKRLAEDWPLEIDATVQYAMANIKCKKEDKPEKCWWQAVTKDDLKIDSPYNTYKNRDLPPAPICNPSLSSIKAAVFPQKTDYWFYLSDSKGNLHFAETLEEQEGNIEKYLK